MEYKLKVNDCIGADKYLKNKNIITKALLYEHLFYTIYPKLKNDKEAIISSSTYKDLVKKIEAHDCIKCQAQEGKLPPPTADLEKEYRTNVRNKREMDICIAKLDESMKQMKKLVLLIINYAIMELKFCQNISY
jgi:hypothetical protein